MVKVTFKLKTTGPILHETEMAPEEIPRLRERVILPGSRKQYEVRSVGRRFTKGLSGLVSVHVEVTEPPKVSLR